MLRSMTGFGRCLVENTGQVQQWEIRSVNSRHLDIKWRLPLYARFMEPTLEKVVRRHASRGRVEISLQLQFAPGQAPRPVFDSALAAAMLDSLAELAASRQEDFKPDFGRLMEVERLWAEPEIDRDDELRVALEGGLAIALADWNESREVEGAALGRDLQARIQHMEEWTNLIAERAPVLKEEKFAILRERLESALDAAGSELDESRFLQEVTLLADRLDISEELTRLLTHLERLEQLLHQGDDAGRRLDFTLQECFREINTCGNKIADAQISRIVVEIKNELEKCREQVQNLE